MRGIGLVLGVVACAHTVPQDLATGADGKIKGARPLHLENGEARTHGIVTYPGGDRVDWKLIELPQGKQGKLDLQMTWQSPRPGLQVAFDVFDQWNAPIVATKAAGHRHGRTRTASIEHAHGTYFVRVFAPRRGDAGAYNLVASFEEDPPVVHVSADVPEPPPLPAVPPAERPCLTLDPNNPTCADACPDDAPATWKGCQHTCRTPDVNNPSCLPTMACPTSAPDERIKACMASPAKFWPPCPDFDNPDPGNPRCRLEHPAPVVARILHVDVQADGVLVKIGVGLADHVGKRWKGVVLSGTSDTPLANGQLTIIRVEKTQTIAKSKLTVDLLTANPQVRLSPL